MLRKPLMGTLVAAVFVVGGCGSATRSTSTETATVTETSTALATATKTKTVTRPVTTTETTTETTTVTTTVTNPGGGGNGGGGNGGGGNGGGDCNGADPCPPRGPSGANGTYNCSDFDTQQQAQDYYDQVGDIDGLDADQDGIACESLP